jgi:nitric oxide reductase NorE protein
MTEAMAAAPRQAGHWPGEPALWSLICADMALFGFMFVVYAHDRAQNMNLFEAARPAMNQSLGLAATLLLLASSWFIASAVQAARLDRARIARFCVLPGLICAVAFCVLKYFDYAEKIQAGITPNTNLFFTYYFALTGIHLVHVLAAIAVMSWAGLRLGRPATRQVDFVFLESAASFWHLVDILWIMLFALLFLIG